MFKPKKVHSIAAAASITALALALAVMSPPVVAQASPAATAEQSSTEAGVTVKVTPKSISSPGRAWEFSISLKTHSGELSDDLMQNATLSTDDGRTLKPARWTGTAPGGHQREGVLSFEVPAPRPSAVELRIARPGESAPRTFRWQL